MTEKVSSTDMFSTIENFVKNEKDFLKVVSDQIWRNPELCFQEHFAHDLLTSTLEKFGFDVKRQYMLPTAFRPEFDSGREGPAIAAICEYDALPSIGHACGHNLMAEIGLGVGLAVQSAIKQDSSISGKIIVLGTPAEEVGGGKIKLIEKGAFKDIDAAVLAHPQSMNRLYPLIVECKEMVITFKTDHESNPWQDFSAVDAAVACYNNITLMRRGFKNNWRISLVLPECSSFETEVSFFYRAPTQLELTTLYDKIILCVEAASRVTNCTYEIVSEDDDGSRYRGILYNGTMCELFGMHAKALGMTFHDNDPKYAESAVSTDMGNVTQIVPGIHPNFFIGACSPHFNHTPGFADFAVSDMAQESTLVVIEALAKTVVELMSNSDLMARVKTEFDKNPLRDSDSYARKAGKIK